MSTPRLAVAVRRLLLEAAQAYRDRPRVAALVRENLSRLDGPLRIAVAGRAATGKSTVVNALIGEQLAPARFPGGDQYLTRYQDGPALWATGTFRHSPAVELVATRVETGLLLELPRRGHAALDGLDHVSVAWPSRALRGLAVVDTPPLAGPGEGERDRVARRLHHDADAVVYLARYPESEQLAGLRATDGSASARQTGVQAILVLSRSDEMGAGRIDALLSAKQLARRSRREHPSCASFQSVIAVAGQLALAGRTLCDNEFAALCSLAAVPRAELDRFLLSVDEFIGGGFPARLAPTARRSLLARFGLFGVRLSATLIRTGCDTRLKLSAQLVQHSGIGDLRDAIDAHFVARGEVLKARSALLALETILLAEPHPSAQRLTSRWEQVLAGAHDFRELRLIAALEGGRASVPAGVEGYEGEAMRLMGAAGTSVVDRLGVAAETTEELMFSAAVDALSRWRRAAEESGGEPAARASARIVVRSCEGMLAQFD